MEVSSYTRATALVIGLMSVCPSSADGLCDADDAFHRSGVSPHKACIAAEVPEFADYSNLLSHCTLKIHITDLDKSETLESGLLAAYRRHIEVLPWCNEKEKPVIEFEKARHGYQQLSAWKAAAEMALHNSETGSVANVALCDATLHVSATGDAEIRGVSEQLGELGIPGHAYVLGPGALNSRGIPIIGLPAAGREDDDRVSLPVSFSTREPGGELTIGHTSLNDAIHLLPPCPGHGPPEVTKSKPSVERPGATTKEPAETDDQILYAYIPAQASMRLVFDESRRLAALMYFVENDQEGLSELVEGISDVVPLQRIYADDRIIFLAGESRSVFVTLGAERDWYDKPYRVGISYAYSPGTDGAE